MTTPDVPRVRELPPIQTGSNYIYRQCEYCGHIVASATLLLGNDAHYCMRENLVTFVMWIP
jgi:hypothetical protein